MWSVMGHAVAGCLFISHNHAMRPASLLLNSVITLAFIASYRNNVWLYIMRSTDRVECRRSSLWINELGYRNTWVHQPQKLVRYQPASSSGIRSYLTQKSCNAFTSSSVTVRSDGLKRSA